MIGHEFSHILNGDMRLNVRLIGVLFGMQMVAGFGQKLMNFGMHSGDSGQGNGKNTPLHLVFLVTGAMLFMIGYLGIFFGCIIKSAVSRQREFLADASAIQFTRNPDGIGQALRKIGGLNRAGFADVYIRHPNAEHLSHLFLSAARPNLLAGWFATHPPLRERLCRIYGRDVGMLDAPEMAAEESFQFPAAPELLPDLPCVAAGFAAAAAAAAASLFMRSAAACSQRALSEQDLIDVQILRFSKIKAALERANQLAPLAKPALIKALIAVVGEHDALPLGVADLLRAICAALEAPMLPARSVRPDYNRRTAHS